MIRILAATLFFFIPAGAASTTVTARAGDLQKTIDGASNGDTIIIAPGHYRVNNLAIDKSLHLIGKGWPLIDGGGHQNVITVRAGNCTIRGLHIVNSGKSDLEEYAGIRLETVSGGRIENNRFNDNYFAIYLAGVSGCVVKNNVIKGKAVRESASGNGIHLWKCHHIAITGNSITRHRDGIYIEFAQNSFVAGNHCEGNLRYGLHFMFSDSSSYRYNRFIRNGTGVAVMYTRGVVMSHNLFGSNLGSNAYGLLLKDISHSTIAHNRFANNTSGLYMEGSNDVIVEKNRFTSNGSAIRLLGNCFNDTIRFNIFEDNVFDLTTNAQNNMNVIEMNHWDQYTGYDLNKDGQGDVPYCPVSLYSKVTEEYPASLILLNSFFTNVLNQIESLVPTLVPAQFSDHKPLMKDPAL